MSPPAQIPQMASHPECKPKTSFRSYRIGSKASPTSALTALLHVPLQLQGYSIVRPCKYYFPTSGLLPSTRETPLIPTWLAVNISRCFQTSRGVGGALITQKKTDREAILTIF